MSVKGIIRRVTTFILAIVMFWITIIATSDEDTQPQAIIPKTSGVKQKRVMDVDEVCNLLSTERLKKENPSWSPEKVIIRDIHISMDKICEKEKSFEDNAVPAAEIVNGKLFEVIYLCLSIGDITIEDTKTVMESKHIQALHKFLQMFTGRKINSLSIENKKMTQDKKELQKIEETLQANPWVSELISVKVLDFFGTINCKTTPPVLLQLIVQAVGNTEAPEKMEWIGIPISVNDIQEAFQLLGHLKCRKVKRVYIWIDVSKIEVTKAQELNPKKTVQEWTYEVEELKIASERTHTINSRLPSWLKPIKDSNQLFEIRR